MAFSASHMAGRTVSVQPVRAQNGIGNAWQVGRLSSDAALHSFGSVSCSHTCSRLTATRPIQPAYGLRSPAAPVTCMCASFTACQRRCSATQLRRGSVCRAALDVPQDFQPQKKRIAVFVSGGGSNFKAIHAACQDGRIKGEVVVVVSDVPTCGGVQYAQQHGIASVIFPAPKSGAFPGLTPPQLLEALQGEGVDYVVLAGFLKLIPAELVRAFPRRILNIHPALLPSFGGKGYYGVRVHQAVVAAGVRVTGPTVHFVDEEYDRGAIVAQTAVPVYPTDTPAEVAARVLKQEHIVYPMVLAALCDGRLSWRPDGVPVIWNAQ